MDGEYGEIHVISEARRRANRNYYAKNREKLKREARDRHNANADSINARKRADRASVTVMKAMGIKS